MEARKTILLEKEHLLRVADVHRISVVGVSGGET
jgi:hypothetical protein